jgi:predicted AAA+ superfamily ATPase
VEDAKHHIIFIKIAHFFGQLFIFLPIETGKRIIMVTSEKITEILRTAETDIFATRIFQRDIYPFLKENFLKQQPLVLHGIRRSGKTYMMYQLFKEFPEACYINFEDERLTGITSLDLEEVYSTYIGMKSPARPVMFLDEVQNVKGWEKFVSRLSQKVKFVISGSNASLLSSEYSTALTGRHIPIRFYPLSFREYLDVNQAGQLDFFKTEEQARIFALLSEFQNFGGFPQASVEKDISLLRSTFDSIIYRDIVPRFGVQNGLSLEVLAKYLVSNPGKFFSYRNLCSIANIKHEDTIKKYIDYMEKAYLFSSVFRFDYSLRKQMANPKKVYPADTGFTNYSGSLFSKETGRLLETIVYNELKRSGHGVFYWKNERGREVDFVVCDGLKPVKLIQVSERIDDAKQMAREVKPLNMASEELNVKEMLLLTWKLKPLAVPPSVRCQSVAEWLLKQG